MTSYIELLEGVGVGTVIEVVGGSYQGDLYLLVHDNVSDRHWKRAEGAEWAFMTVGYGSCSGCDALESCSTPQQVAELALSLVTGLEFTTLAQVRAKVTNSDKAELQWYGAEEAFKEFQAKVAAYTPEDD